MHFRCSGTKPPGRGVRAHLAGDDDADLEGQVGRLLLAHGDGGQPVELDLVVVLLPEVIHHARWPAVDGEAARARRHRGIKERERCAISGLNEAQFVALYSASASR